MQSSLCTDVPLPSEKKKKQGRENLSPATQATITVQCVEISVSDVVVPHRT